MPRLSLAEQIAQFDDAAPVDFDPEAFHDHGMHDDKPDIDQSAAREHYVDAGPSSLRGLQASVADPKYDGVLVSRKAIFDDDDFERGSKDEFEPHDSEVDDDFDVAQNESDYSDDLEPSGSEDNDVREDENLGEVDEDEAPKNSKNIRNFEPRVLQNSQKRSQLESGSEEDLISSMKQTREADRRKGNAVAKQIALWDTLLDARIRLQKSAVAANKLPQPSEMEELFKIPECATAVSKLLEETLALADDLFELEEGLLKTNESISPPARKRRKVESDDNPHNFIEDLASATEVAARFEQLYHPHLLQVLSKWSAKIQAVSPSVLLPSNRGAFSKSGQHLKSAVQLVDDALLDHPKLLARTQVRRSKGSRIGITETEEDQEKEDAEIFDDNDFYQKLLRDIIDSRGDGKGGSNDWMAVQKQKKAKKKVDTRASKGRKLRYEVQEKIQNFMVPVPAVGGWHDEQIDELFASILGKGFESSTTNIEGPDIEQHRLLNEALQTGFRVFG